MSGSFQKEAPYLNLKLPLKAQETWYFTYVLLLTGA